MNPSNKNETALDVQSLASLHPYLSNWKTKALLTNKGSLHTYKNAKGEGCLFSVELTDKDADFILSYDPNFRLAFWPSAEAARTGIMSIRDQANVVKDFHGKIGGVKVKCVDTTGDGDAFVGGLLNSLASNPQLLKDEKLRAALRFANMCGSYHGNVERIDSILADKGRHSEDVGETGPEA